MKRYHVSSRSDGCYQAKLENGERASVVCSTQAEAIAAAKSFSENAQSGGVVLIHADRDTQNHVKGRIRDCVSVE